MYSSSHEQQQFAEAVAQRQQVDDQALANDPGVQSARNQLADRQRELQGLQNYIAGLPARDRFQYLGNVDQALQAIEEAKQAELKAHNDFWRDRHAAAKAQEKAEQKRLAEEEQKQYAQQQEAQFKEAKRTAYLAAGATEAQFLAAYPDLWQEELRRRADEQEKGLQQRMHREVGYIRF